MTDGDLLGLNESGSHDRVLGAEQIGWACPREGLAWPVVDLLGDVAKPLDGDQAQVGAFGEVVPQ